MSLENLRFVRLQRGQRLHLWSIGTRKPVEVLTVRRVRHITFASSWRPARTGNEHGATLPENPASRGLSGHNDMCINGAAAGSRKKRPAGVLYGLEPALPGLRYVRQHETA
jgi:hypothetical protein